MTPKEKAFQLICKFHLVNSESVELITGEYDLLHRISPDDAVQCALVGVDEIIEAIKNQRYGVEYLSERDYWFEVKQEIKNL